MLNKNQSKKRNLLKYYVVIPALAAFVFLFQIEVIAKEKRETKKEITKDGIKEVDVYKIRKTTTDQELNEMAEKLKLNHNIDFKVSGIERNSSNELTAIKVNVKIGSEENQAFSIDGNKAIKDCGVIVVTDDDGSKKITLITDNKIDESKITNKEKIKVEVMKVEKSKTNTNVNTNSTTVTKTNNTTNDNTNVSVNSTVNGTVIVSTAASTQPTAKISPNALYIIDGVVVSDIDVKNIDPATIESMSVFKGPEAIAKYGEKGKDGVIVIETKK